MASNRFLMVPEDSSAARMPLPGATMAVAILLSSVRFIERSSQNDSALACENSRFSGICRVNVRRRAKGDIGHSGARRLARARNPLIRVDGGTMDSGLALRAPGMTGEGACDRLRHLGVELALGVALGHVGGGQHLLELGGLPCGVELLEPLLAELGHGFHRR